MDPSAESSPQTIPQNEAISRELTSFHTKLNARVIEIASADATKENDYKIVIENNPGDTYISETWSGGSRVTRKFNENFQATSESGAQPGDFYVNISSGQGYNDTEITINIKAEGSLTQITKCSTENAKSEAYGRQPLMQGEFFKWAGQGQMIEEKSITPEGKVFTRRSWSEDKWLGNDRYRQRVVTEENGVIKHGEREHGISLGIREMKVVSSPTQE